MESLERYLLNFTNFERTVSALDPDNRRDEARKVGPRPCLGKGWARVAFAVVATLMVVWWHGTSGYCDDVDNLINQLLKRSGMRSEVKGMIPAMVAALPGDAFSDSDLKWRVRRRVEAGLSDEALLEMVRNAVRKDFDRPKLEEVLAFYESKLGRRMGYLQASSLGTSALSEVREGRKNLALMPDARLALFQRIVRAQQVSHTVGHLFESMVAGLAEGSYGPRAGEAQAAQRKLRPFMDRAVAMDEIFEQMAVTSLARTFRSLSNEELEELANFEESDAARWFRRSTLPGLEKIVHAIGSRLGSELREVQSKSGGKQR